MKEALFFKQLSDKKVQCLLCPHFCVIESGEKGKCRGRQNKDGILYAINYAKTVTINMDPIEKKPLYHFYPGESALSIGPNSCNFACDFCQNYTISQFIVPTTDLPPERLVALCKQHSSNIVAFTYTEPITWYEYILDSSKLLKEKGIKTVMVTNGFINPKPLKKLLPYIDAMNIDLKSMDNSFYERLCYGKLEPVLETIKTVASSSCHLEITNLIITDENDTDELITELVDFVASVNPDIPVHFSRYYPHFKMSNPPTRESTLYHAKDLAMTKLNYVYLGNIITESHTRCPECRNMLIRRNYVAIDSKIKDGKCPKCNHHIYGKFD